MRGSVALHEYGSIARLLHWLTVLLVLVAWATGAFGDDANDRGDAAILSGMTAGLHLHIWAGLMTLSIALFRFPWRILHPPPPTEANEFNRWLIAWTDPTARLTQYTLYILLLSVPIVGIMTLFLRGQSLSLFGLAVLASPFEARPPLAHTLKEVHEILAYMLLMVASFHTTAAVIHYVVFRDDTMKRMLPWLSGPKTARD